MSDPVPVTPVPAEPAGTDWKALLQKVLYWVLIALAGAGGGAVGGTVCSPGCQCQHQADK